MLKGNSFSLLGGRGPFTMIPTPLILHITFSPFTTLSHQYPSHPSQKHPGGFTSIIQNFKKIFTNIDNIIIISLLMFYR